MRGYNPKQKHFIYGMDMLGPAAGIRATGRTPISSDSWFDLYAISIQWTEAAPAIPQLMPDNMYLNIFDEGTGRNLTSEPFSVPALIPSYGTIGTAAMIAAAANTYFPTPKKPYYFKTPYRFRPGSVIRADVDNRDAALNMTTFRIYYHGVKVFDIGARDLSPGAVFAPFTYLATPGAMATGVQTTTQIATQSDADFDIVDITTNIQTYDESNIDADQAFISLQDQTTGYQYQDRPVCLTHFVGTPVCPYKPIRPIRVSRAGGLQVVINNVSGVTFANPQVAFNGYKIFR